MNKERITLIFKLLKEGKINEDEATLLLEADKEYINYPVYQPYNPNPYNPPYGLVSDQYTISEMFAPELFPQGGPQLQINYGSD